eukprot:881367-Pleurochrysis_carterae.AAC.1
MPNKLIRKGFFSELHFDPDYDFLYKERDKVRAARFRGNRRGSARRTVRRRLEPFRLVGADRPDSASVSISARKGRT